MHLPWREVASGAGPAISTSITERETERLRELANGQLNVLEIGAAYGYSTVVLAQQAAWVTSIDPHLAHHSAAAQGANLKAYGVREQVDVYQSYSQHVLPDLVETGEEFDLIFIDGDHTAAGVRFDLEHALRLIKPGGVIAVHDVLETCCCPDVGPTTDLVMRDHPAGGVYEVVDTMAVFQL